VYLRIERGSSAPISRQIAEQIRAQCLSGMLKPGDCLPSVRQLAREQAVNVNTVFRVYERLVAEGLIEMRHGEGTFVSPPSADAKTATELKQQREQYAREFEALVRRGLLLGVTTQELRGMLSATVSHSKAQISQKTSSEEFHE
jgi:GntR family transcriptional regulator